MVENCLARSVREKMPRLSFGICLTETMHRFGQT